MGSFNFDIGDVLGLCGISANIWPGRGSVDVNCPFCGDGDKKRHLNINLRKNVWRCNKCEAHGGMLDLYAQIYGITSKEAYREIEKRLGKVYGDVPERKKCVVVNECREDPYAPAGIVQRDVAYRFLLTHMKLTEFHRQNLLSRGLTDEQIRERCYRSVPVIGHARIVSEMLKAGIDPKGVPGFYMSDRNGQKTWTLRDYPSGIMVPVRDIQLSLLDGIGHVDEFHSHSVTPRFHSYWLRCAQERSPGRSGLKHSRPSPTFPETL